MRQGAATGGTAHDIEGVIVAIMAKLRAKSDVLARAEDHFTVEVYRKGAGYDVKLKTII